MPKGYRLLSGSGYRRETSQLSYPRLCDNRQGHLIGGPRKTGDRGPTPLVKGPIPPVRGKWPKAKRGRDDGRRPEGIGNANMSAKRSF